MEWVEQQTIPILSNQNMLNEKTSKLTQILYKDIAMGYKCLSTSLRMKNKDRVIKPVSEYDKKLIINMYATGNYKYADLARIFDRAKDTIRRIIDPEFTRLANARRNELRNNDPERASKRARYNEEWYIKRKMLYEQNKLQQVR